VIRRKAVVFLFGLCLVPYAHFAKAQGKKSYRVGFLGTAFRSGYVQELEWIRAGLRAHGYVEGANLTIEYRWAEGDPGRIDAIAAEFAALKLDAIIVHGLPGAIAARRASSTIPVVMADGADPVAAGVARSFARPGTNVTGSTSFVREESGKRLQLLKELAPAIKRAAFLYSAQHPAGVIALNREELENAAATMKVELREFVIKEGVDFPAVFSAMSRSGIDAVVVNSEPLLNSQARQIADLAVANRMAAVGYASFADAGGLLAYGANRAALYGRVGYFLDRIIKGTPPGEIPIEQAAKFDTVINMKAVRALGLKLPKPVLLRADRVIE
jgi:ABC-type uncharacterized transport system substrate-binding protein